MASPVELHPLAPTTPVHRVEGTRRDREPPRRQAQPDGKPAAPEPETVDADGHIDTHV